MGNYTREEILQMVEEEDVEFIRLQFTDMFGAIKNIAVTARELPRALNNQCVIDGEQIAGTSGLKDADLYLRPVLDTFAILPWRPQQGKVARMICDLYFPDGTPYKNSPRYILENVAGKAQDEGYTCYIDPECEFFLFHTDDNGNPTTVMDSENRYIRMAGFPVIQCLCHIVISVVIDMIGCRLDYIESCIDQCITNFRRSCKGWITTDSIMVCCKDGFLVYHGNIGSLDLIFDIFVNFVIVPCTRVGFAGFNQ